MTSLLLNVQNLAKHSAIANNNEEKCENHWMFNQHQSKSKDLDQVSIASSTHFTLVNGCGRDGNIKTNSSFCRHDRKITILTMTMTLVFIIGIIIAIYFMERKSKFNGHYDIQINLLFHNRKSSFHAVSSPVRTK